MRSLLISIFLILFTSTPMAFPPAQGVKSATESAVPVSGDASNTLTVRITNGTTGGPGVADVIEIFSLSGGGMDALSSQQNAGPAVQFPDLKAGDTYLVRAEYQGAAYSEQVVFQPGEEGDLIIYDAVADDPGVQIQLEHIVYQVEGDTLFINRRYVITNPTLTTWVNNAGTFFFTVPEGGSDVVAQISHGMIPIPMTPQNTGTPGRYNLSRPIPPQKTLVDVEYSMPYSEGKAAVSEPLEADVSGLLVAVVPQDVQVKSDHLLDQGVQQEENARIFAVNNLTKGGVLTISLEGRGTPGAAHTHDEGENRLVMTPAHDMKVVLMYTLGFALILVLCVVMSRRRITPEAEADELLHKTTAELEMERDALLARIAELDGQHENGAVAESEYNNRRQSMKLRAKAVMRRLAELGQLPRGEQ